MNSTISREGDGGAERWSSALWTEGVVKSYRGRRVVDEVDLRLEQGEIVGLLGPNGAGKTTTFDIIVGLIRPDRGSIYLNGRTITDLPMYRRARMGIGFLPQEPSVFRRLTVEENLLAILEVQGLSRAEREQRLEELLAELELTPLRRQKAYSLSGGERRRLEITRTLISQPRFFLLDEPFVGIDPIAVDEIQGIVHRLKERGLGILITDHNVRETLEITDRAYIMFEGKIRLSGTADRLIEDPEARAIYLGENFRM